MIDKAEAVLPEPDSPTRATVSRLPMVNETPLTAWLTVSPERKSTDKLRTSTRGSLLIASSSPVRLARIEGVAHGLADEDQQAEQSGEREEGGEAEPRRLQVRFALRQEFAQ